CRQAGLSGYANGVDIDGEPWSNVKPSIGCDEYFAGAITGALTPGIEATFTNVTKGFKVDFVADITGHANVSQWDFGDGTVVTNRPYVSHSWGVTGDYSVVLRVYNESNPSGVTATVLIHVVDQIYYVAFNGANAVAPYTSWATAATNIQDAVDAAQSGATILVSNGVYATGGRAVNGGITNRVAVTRPVTVRSVNGPAVTVIQGYQVPGTTNGDSAIRCVYLTNGAALVGFTVANGATSGNGGGLYCESTNAFASNCVIIGNSASGNGGGTYYGTLSNCVLKGNSVSFLGGGGSYESTLNNCLITRNSGGGSMMGTLNNCVVSLNTAYGIGSDHGSGVSYGVQNNCTIVSNTGAGAGAYYAHLNNCIVYYNQGNYSDNFYNSTLSNCCSTGFYSLDSGNFTNAPLFVDLAGGNLRLQNNSPCINSGNNAFVVGSADLDGRSRIVGGTVDVGAYEFQGAGMSEFLGWLQQYDLPTDGSADYTDSDGDRMNNWQEWRCGTVPTNSQSVLQMLAPSNNLSGIVVQWASVNTRTYCLERSTNLGDQPPFLTLATNIVGQAGVTSYTDTNAVGNGPFFYRVKLSP